jgi:hypothetical protein
MQYPKYHYYEVCKGPSAQNLLEGILGFAETRGMWAKVECDHFTTLVTVEVDSSETSGMFDLLFGGCEKY